MSINEALVSAAHDKRERGLTRRAAAGSPTSAGMRRRMAKEEVRGERRECMTAS